MVFLELQEFLSRIIIQNELIHLDLWSIIHFIFGIILMSLIIKSNLTIFKKLRKYNRFTALFISLVAFEFVEFFIYSQPNSFIESENLVNVIWDIIISLLGGVFYTIYFKV